MINFSMPIGAYKTCKSSGAMILLLMMPLLSVCAHAESQLRRDYTADDRILINETTLRYRDCVYQKAQSEIDKHHDIRQTAGIAVDACQYEMDQLDQELTKRELDPDFYHGMLMSIKNRTINRLLPALMMQKSSKVN